jgi:hypothetical protein
MVKKQGISKEAKKLLGDFGIFANQIFLAPEVGYM